MKRIAIPLVLILGLMTACNGNDQVVQERDALIQERDVLMQERDELQRQVTELTGRADTLVLERDDLTSQLETRTQELEATRQELLERTVERDQVLADLQAQFEDSLANVRRGLQEMEGLTNTIEAEREELRTRVDEGALPPLTADTEPREAATAEQSDATAQVERLRGQIEQLEQQADQP